MTKTFLHSINELPILISIRTERDNYERIDLGLLDIINFALEGSYNVTYMTVCVGVCVCARTRTCVNVWPRNGMKVLVSKETMFAREA